MPFATTLNECPSYVKLLTTLLLYGFVADGITISYDIDVGAALSFASLLIF